MKQMRYKPAIIAAAALALTFAKPAFASHAGEPGYKGVPPAVERHNGTFCEGADHIDIKEYDLDGDSVAETILFFYNSSETPIAVYVRGGDQIWFDLDLDDHMDGSAEYGEYPVFYSPCDLVEYLKRKSRYKQLIESMQHF